MTKSQQTTDIVSNGTEDRRSQQIFKNHVPNGLSNQIYETLSDVFNEQFLEHLSERVKHGLRYLVETFGAVPGKPPKGFMRDPVIIGTDRHGTSRVGSRWVPDPNQWEICRTAWDLRASGASFSKIHQATRLFNSPKSYGKFFANRIYRGELVYGDIVIPHYCQPLVTQEIWDAVQSIRHPKSRPGIEG